MAQPRHKAIVAGLTLTLTFGCLSVPAIASTASANAAYNASLENLPAPSEFDRGGEYEAGTMAESAIELAAVDATAVSGISDEMKYFTRFESNCNYDQGFSYGDGYNAMGYYQFDRRYSLVPFIESVYGFNPTKYAMFKDVVARGDELKSAPIYDAASKTLTEIGRMANDAWHLAYATDPVEFAALQDSYSFNNYYKPVERLLKSSYGIDISARADCVKGLAWGMCNLFGSGGVQKFFAAASLDGGMTDRELVESLCNSVTDYFSTGAGKNHAYAAGYVNRYKQEKRICLEYVAQHEAEQQRPGDAVTPEGEDQTEAPDADGGADSGQEGGQQDAEQEGGDQKPEGDSDGGASDDAGDNGGTDGSNDEEQTDGPQTDAGNESDDGSSQGGSDEQGDSAAGDDADGSVDADDAPLDSPSEPNDNAANGSQGDVEQEEPQASKPGSQQEGDGQESEAVQKYEVTFDDCDPLTDNVVLSVSANAALSSEHALPQAPAYEGFSFDGWYYYDRATRTYGEKFDPSAPVTVDTYVAAKWTEVEQQIVATPAPDVKQGESASVLPQTFDLAGTGAIAATVLSAAGTVAIAYGGKRKDDVAE